MNKAKLIRSIMHSTMNLDLHELIEAKVFSDDPRKHETQWEKWNKDAPLQIVKMGTLQLEVLASLVDRKLPDVFGGDES